MQESGKRGVKWFHDYQGERKEKTDEKLSVLFQIYTKCKISVRGTSVQIMIDEKKGSAGCLFFGVLVFHLGITAPFR